MQASNFSLGRGWGRGKEGVRDGGRSEERRWTRRRGVGGGGRAKHTRMHAPTRTHARTHAPPPPPHTHTIGVGTKDREEADSFGFQHRKRSLYDSYRTNSKARSFKRCIKHSSEYKIECYKTNFAYLIKHSRAITQ